MELEEHRRRRRSAIVAAVGWGLVAGVISEVLLQATRSHRVAFAPLAVWGMNAAYRLSRVANAHCLGVGTDGGGGLRSVYDRFAHGVASCASHRNSSRNDK